MREHTLSREQALQRLTALCATGEHCSYDLAEKMRRWGMDERQQADVLAYLADHRFVDDRRYARAFAKDKLHYNKWGPRKIEQALWAKHIDEETRKEALSELTDDDFTAVLAPLLRTRRRGIRTDDSRMMQAKLVRFAMGRGFTMDQIRRCTGSDPCDGMDDE